MTREKIKKITEKAVRDLYKKNIEVEIDRPQDLIFGDYSTNVAMVLKKNPQEIADRLKSEVLEKIEVKNGFINFFLSKNYLQKQIKEILKEKDRFGEVKIGRREKINVEFISANPTGPLTLGNGRGGFCGDILANVLAKAGFQVKREYYINDVGEQVRKLGHSILGDSQAVYRGKYIEDLRKKLKPVLVKTSPEKIGEKASKIILEEMIKPTTGKMKIKFDTWFSEKSLYRKKETDKVIDFLKKKDLLYEKEGAFWFKSSEFGDDKDRVLIKADGEPTYFLSDMAYLRNKFKRGFKKLFFFWGADHFGYINRIKAAAEVLGFNKENIKIIIVQLVRLFKDGKDLKMAKRTGSYITLDELIGEVGLDVARFFFLTRSPDSHFNFDLDLAKEQSEKNPVYYVQYAYARICSILKKTQKTKNKAQNCELLNHPSELNLIKQLVIFPDIVEDAAKDYQVQRISKYALDLATVFHQFYRDCKVLTENVPLSEARLGLLLSAQIVFKNTLTLMGVSAPQKM